MSTPPADRARAYRERKRNGVTRHTCSACGHAHYPAPSQRDATGHASQRDACGHEAQLTAMAARLDQFATAGRRWQARATAYAAELAAHGLAIPADPT